VDVPSPPVPAFPRDPKTPDKSGKRCRFTSPPRDLVGDEPCNWFAGLARKELFDLKKLCQAVDLHLSTVKSALSPAMSDLAESLYNLNHKFGMEDHVNDVESHNVILEQQVNRSDKCDVGNSSAVQRLEQTVVAANVKFDSQLEILQRDCAALHAVLDARGIAISSEGTAGETAAVDEEFFVRERKHFLTSCGIESATVWRWTIYRTYDGFQQFRTILGRNPDIRRNPYKNKVPIEN